MHSKKAIDFFNDSFVETLDELKIKLLEQEYTACYKQLLASGYGLIHTPRRNLVYSTGYGEKLVALFANNVVLQQHLVDQIFGSLLLQKLLRANILENVSDSKIISNFRIIPVGIQFFLAIPYKSIIEPPVYIGADSLTFSRMIQVNKFPKYVLDLATGSGYQLFALPWQNENAHFIGIDINPNAIATATINAQWNNTPWITFHYGDITTDLSSILNNKFDLIMGNPPIIPTPKTEKTRIQNMLHANGGEDGSAIVEAFLPQLPNLLAETGSAQFILCSLGDEKEPYLIKKLEKLLEEIKLYGNLITIKKIPVALDSFFRGHNDLQEYQRWIRFYKQQKATYWYRLILRLEYKANKDILPVTYHEFLRTDYSKPPIRGSLGKEDIFPRMQYYLRSILPKRITLEEIEKWYLDLKKYVLVHWDNVFTKSIVEFSELLKEEYPAVFETLGNAIRFWGMCTEKYWWIPKYQERVLL